MVPPAEFIPIAESTGLIVDIGHWVMCEAAAQASRWRRDGLPPLSIAVDLSAVQFRNPRLSDRVAQVLDEAGLPAEALELELTEATTMEDPQKAVLIIDQLSARGIAMSIDDFGTGHSSLSYLKRFRVGRLKIDRSFVRDITEDAEDKAIVAAIIQLANNLGMTTIAEGVETAGQLDFLREQGCDAAQGYFFSRPLSASDFERYLSATLMR
ncbi:putative signaling protein [bioreactor metagenome]|uniref:Putative signaling protein n=1 Tax=bioreactor metagenome TaxID=1076179 RepID=A0A645ET97_9ZZZZ